MEGAEIYIDESGSTGADLRNSNQPNFLLAAVVIPSSRDAAFWCHANRAWNLAAGLLDKPLEGIELKGSELFGGKGIFRGADGHDRIDILSTVFDALIQHGVVVFWDGYPKASLSDVLDTENVELSAKQLAERVVMVFADSLHCVIARLRPEGPMFVMADELPTRPSGQALQCDSWIHFEENAVYFGSSVEAHGLQVADIVAHTLARSNRASLPAGEAPRLSNTDQLAVQFRQELAAASRWVNLSQHNLA